jgi:putative transposase
MRLIDPNTGQPFVAKSRRRLDEPFQARELTFSCFNRFKFLSADSTRKWFVDAVESARKQYSMQIWAYVLMPEHVHMIIYPGPNPENVSPFLRSLKEKTARPAIRQLKLSNPEWLNRIAVREGKRTRHRFWQPGGGYDRNISSSRALYLMID